MNHPASASKAKARLRARAKPRPAPPANDNIVRLAPPAPLQLTAEYVIHEDGEEAPFAPPPVDDIFGLDECDEEETVFVAAAPAAEEPKAPAGDAAAGAAVPEAEAAVPEAEAAVEEDAPFDPPEFEDEPVFTAPASAQIEPVAAAPPNPEAPAPKPFAPMEIPRERPAPAISIYASWDRPEAEALLQAFARDPRLARAEIEVARGGLDGAVARCARHGSPDLLILDTTLQGNPMLAELDRLLEVMTPSTKIVVIGAVNDIGLLRELAARGVSDYIVPPAKADDLARSACQLFAETDNARVIAVVGARGGLGASTLAHNIAWSIAERQQQRTALVDLDLSFGSAALSFQTQTELSVVDVLRAGDDADETLMRAMAKVTPRLHLLSAPPCVEGTDFDCAAFGAMISQVRRSARYIVLDLPHVWETWVRQAMSYVDELVIVSGPDLASLRNTDNILKLLRSERDQPSPPMVVLSMVGVPKRPEIPFKDFAEALHTKPTLTFAFEPELFAAAAAEGRMLYEAMPSAKAALSVDMLATMLTGHEAVAKPEPRSAPKLAAPIAKAAAKPAEAPATTPAETPAAKTAQAKAEAAPVLDLVTPAPREAKPASRRTTPRRAEPLRTARRSTGLVRAAIALLVVGLSMAWQVQQERDAAAAPAQVAVAPPAETPAAHFATLRRQAEIGDAAAQYRLAKAFERGDGVPASLSQARHWTERAAAAGNVRAMHDLGVYFARGEGGPEGDAGAFRWFRQAAEFGMADSQFNLGVLYQQGRGVSADAGEALFWFMLAARNGDRGAGERVQSLEAQLTPMQIEQARARAEAFSPRSAGTAADGA